jgi:hypothetical protein
MGDATTPVGDRKATAPSPASPRPNVSRILPQDQADAARDELRRVLQTPSGASVEAGSSLEARGSHEGQRAGVWGSFAPAALVAGETRGAYDSEAAAIAAAKALGTPAVIYLETGRYFVHTLIVESMFDFTYDALRIVRGGTLTHVRCEPDVWAVVTEDGVPLRPGVEMERGATDRIMDGADARGSRDADPYAGYREALGPGLGAAKQREDFLTAFHAAMKDGALAVLERSQQEVRRKRDAFARGPRGVSASELETLHDTASQLAGLDARIREKSWEFGVASIDKSEGFNPRREERKLAIDREISALRQQRREVLARYPMLGRVSDTQAFAAKDATDQLSALGADAERILRDIAATRADVIDGDLNLWGVPSLVDATRAGLGLSAEGQAWVQAKVTSEARAKAVTDAVLAVFGLAFGIAAAVASGGTAVAFAAGALGTGVVDAVRTTQGHLVASSAANTALDPGQALVPGDLSGDWAWLVLAWVGVGLDAADVVKAVRAVKAGTAIGESARQLARSEKELEKLLAAAGELEPGALVTEANRAALSRRLGASIDVDPALGSEVRVHYTLDAQGRVTGTFVKVGDRAPVVDVLLHRRTVQLLERYSGLTGRLRELWERLTSFATGRARHLNPFPPGSRAYESWLELEKLPLLMEARRRRLGPGGTLTREAEALLEEDLRFLESELAHHREVVEALATEKGSGFIAKAARTNEAALKAGYPKPPNPDWYYYVQPDAADPHRFVLRRYVDAPEEALPLKPEIVDGKPTGKFVSGELTRAEEAEALVKSWPQSAQDAFHAAEAAAAKKFGANFYKLVPIEGMSRTPTKLGTLFTKAQAEQLRRIVREMLERQGRPAGKADVDAVLAPVLGHDITVVRGTDQLRAFNYRTFYEKAGVAAEGDLHHLIPLYLGGDHRRLLDMEPDLHKALHELVDSVSFRAGTLAPHSVVQAVRDTFVPAMAALLKDGSIVIKPLTESF